MASEKFSNLGESTVAVAYTATDTTLEVASASSFPTMGVFRVALGNAQRTIFRVDSVAGNVFTGAAEAFDGNAAIGNTVKIVASRAVAERFLQTPSADDIHAYGGVNGASRYGPVFPAGPIVPADFAWVNQGTATVTDANGASYLLAPNAAQNVRLRKKSKSGPFTITILAHFDQTTALNSEMGLMLRESATDKLVAICMRDRDLLSVQRWTGVAAIGTTVFNRTFLAPAPRSLWLRIQHDGTNIISSYSFDGGVFLQIDSHAKTVSFTTDSDEAGYFVNNRSSNADQAMAVASWHEG